MRKLGILQTSASGAHARQCSRQTAHYWDDQFSKDNTPSIRAAAFPKVIKATKTETKYSEERRYPNRPRQNPRTRWRGSEHETAKPPYRTQVKNGTQKKLKNAASAPDNETNAPSFILNWHRGTFFCFTWNTNGFSSDFMPDLLKNISFASLCSASSFFAFLRSRDEITKSEDVAEANLRDSREVNGFGALQCETVMLLTPCSVCFCLLRKRKPSIPTPIFRFSQKSVVTTVRSTVMCDWFADAKGIYIIWKRSGFSRQAWLWIFDLHILVKSYCAEPLFHIFVQIFCSRSKNRVERWSFLFLSAMNTALDMCNRGYSDIKREAPFRLDICKIFASTVRRCLTLTEKSLFSPHTEAQSRQNSTLGRDFRFSATGNASKSAFDEVCCMLISKRVTFCLFLKHRTRLCYSVISLHICG